MGTFAFPPSGAVVHHPDEDLWDRYYETRLALRELEATATPLERAAAVLLRERGYKVLPSDQYDERCQEDEIAPPKIFGMIESLYQLAVTIGILFAFWINYFLVSFPHDWRYSILAQQARDTEGKIAPPKVRGIITSLYQLMTTIGIMVAFWFNYFVVSVPHGWRYSIVVQQSLWQNELPQPATEKPPQEEPETPLPTETEPRSPSGDFAIMKRLGPNSEPVAVNRLSGISMEQVREILLGDKWLMQYYKENDKAVDIIAEPWYNSSREPHVFSRKFNFTAPVDDVPRAIKRLVSVPDTSSVTAVWQLSSEDGGITMTGQFHAHGVPFGETFRMQETISIRPSPNGAAGLELKKWFHCLWVAPLPWTHAIVKIAVERQGMDKAISGLPAFARILDDLGRT